MKVRCADIELHMLVTQNTCGVIWDVFLGSSFARIESRILYWLDVCCKKDLL